MKIVCEPRDPHILVAMSYEDTSPSFLKYPAACITPATAAGAALWLVLLLDILLDILGGPDHVQKSH